ncbi:FtsX-like permease family protein [Aerophototrophica crusticola]|uniref:FtsX-like permease family protein n=1 Tax=Aerophototrophica crusticola TaxID=1709002 RepID=A0A858R554_9PROT|nr:FtsX-like permease family protein [Rhodospirillaceae bacterium B3]
MFRNYVTVALRNLVKHRLYSAINIVGLAVGLAACILILLFVRNELTFDRHIADAERVYQVIMRAQLPGRPADTVANTQLPMGDAMKGAFPEVELRAAMVQQNMTFRTGEKLFSETVFAADPEFLQIFDLPFLEGDRPTALEDRSGIILSEEVARKYFGDEPALGRVITVDGQHDLRVSGVFKKLPPNTHLQFDVLAPIGSPAVRNLEQTRANWGAISSTTYVKLKPGVDAADFNQRFLAWSKTAFPEIRSPNGIVKLSDIFTPSIRPLLSINTDPIATSMRQGTAMTEIYTFSAVAVLVLAIASINFMNLATARATQRAREVSVRKVVGASRAQLVTQFVSESVLLTLVGLVLAVALVELVLPAYSAFLGKELSFNFLSDPGLAAILLGLTVLVGIAGGTYPAFFLSGFKPAAVLKGASSGVGGGSGRLRMTLVVVQFAISIALMVATAIVYGQFLYAQNKDLGFDKENLVVLEGFSTRAMREKARSVAELIAKDPRVAAASATAITPGTFDENNTNVRMPGRGSSELLVVRNEPVDFDFFDTMGMKLVAGRMFDRNRGTDYVTRPEWMRPGGQRPAGTPEDFQMPAAVILNETAVKRLGFASNEAALGQTYLAGAGQGASYNFTIIGVVQDFHFRSVRDPIAPAQFYVDPVQFDAVAVRVKPGDVPGALAAIDNAWKQFFPDTPAQRVFLDDRIQQLYDQERQMATMFAAFAGLAIIIACLGLFGLASFTAERRTKEIGLRKVLGASVPDIVRLLVWQFSKPVLVANLIAWPIAWYGMGHWLQGFTYRIDMNPALFLGAGVVALAIAWLTVGLHAAKVAQAKPIKALRYE